MLDNGVDSNTNFKSNYFALCHRISASSIPKFFVLVRRCWSFGNKGKNNLLLNLLDTKFPKQWSKTTEGQEQKSCRAVWVNRRQP